MGQRREYSGDFFRDVTLSGAGPELLDTGLPIVARAMLTNGDTRVTYE